MRREALVPPLTRPVVYPEILNIYMKMERWKRLWWSGGLARQPYVLMEELQVAKVTHDRFLQYAQNVQNIIVSSGK